MSEPASFDPWDRQEGETDEAWAAFRAYREMVPDERLMKRSATKKIEVISKWFRDHNWEARCRAYDAHFDKVRIEEREALYRRSAREIAIDHMVALADMRDLFTREIAKLNDVSRASPDMPGLIRPHDLIKLGEVAVKLDRLVRGQTTENVGQGELDLSALSLDEVRALHALLEKAGMHQDIPDE